MMDGIYLRYSVDGASHAALLLNRADYQHQVNHKACASPYYDSYTPC